MSDTKWQWAKAGSKNGTYRDIDDATSEMYTPKDADSGSYLRATVTYEDGEGEGKSAMMVSEFQSQRITGGNDAPEFDDVQDPDGINPEAKAIAKRNVVENTAAGKTVGSPVVATDDNGDTLTYTLEDAEDDSTNGHAALFSIDWGTGQILTKGKLNHEGTDCGYNRGTDPNTPWHSYTVVVRATDPSGIPGAAETANSGAVTVIVTVTDVNEAPAVTTAPIPCHRSTRRPATSPLRWPPTRRPTRTMALRRPPGRWVGPTGASSTSAMRPTPASSSSRRSPTTRSPPTPTRTTCTR